MSAFDDERREELRGRFANVIRVAAGMVANPELWDDDPDTIAQMALAQVLACEVVCGIGGDDD